jgi:hypothetical protein
MTVTPTLSAPGNCWNPLSRAPPRVRPLLPTNTVFAYGGSSLDPDAFDNLAPAKSSTLPLYPRLHLLPCGDVLYSGVFNTHYFTPGRFPSARWHPESAQWSQQSGRHFNKNREEGISKLLALHPPDYCPQRGTLRSKGSQLQANLSSGARAPGIAHPRHQHRPEAAGARV